MTLNYLHTTFQLSSSETDKRSTIFVFSEADETFWVSKQSLAVDVQPISTKSQDIVLTDNYKQKHYRPVVVFWSTREVCFSFYSQISEKLKTNKMFTN